MIVRELFGYSFATWRFHLRGEAIRGPHDVGWMRELAVRKLMRSDVATAPAGADRRGRRATRFPARLGEADRRCSTSASRYAGLVLLDDLYTTAPEADGAASASPRAARDHVLFPWMSVREALDLFDEAEADALVVVDTRGDPPRARPAQRSACAAPLRRGTGTAELRTSVVRLTRASRELDRRRALRPKKPA